MNIISIEITDKNKIFLLIYKLIEKLIIIIILIIIIKLYFH